MVTVDITIDIPRSQSSIRSRHDVVYAYVSLRYQSTMNDESIRLGSHFRKDSSNIENPRWEGNILMKDRGKFTVGVSELSSLDSPGNSGENLWKGCNQRMKKDYIVEQSDIPLYTRISAMPFDIRYERDLIERVCKTVKTPTNFPIDRIRSTSSFVLGF